MKILFLIAGLLVLTLKSYSQETTQPKPLTQEDYLQKSKNQRTAGFIVLGVGTAAFLIPVIIYASDPYFTTSDSGSAAGALSILVGGSMMVGSVNFHCFRKK